MKLSVQPFSGGSMCQVQRPSTGLKTCAPPRIHTVCRAQPEQGSTTNVLERRGLLLGAAAVLGAVQRPQPASAEEAVAAAAPSKSVSNSKYADEADRFELAIPAGWVQAEGVATGNRRTIAFFPPDKPASEVNITVVVTNVSVEFTKLGSFGNVATFASNLVNSLDRSFLLRQPGWARKANDEPVQIANLVDYKEARGQYFVEYTVQKLPEPKRHLLSTLALGNNGRYNRLYTVTAQCGEEELGQYKPVLQAALDSFVARVNPNIA